MAVQTDDRAAPGPLQGILLMIVAMLILPTVDGIAKHLSTEHSPLYIGWARYASASLFVLPFALWRARTGRSMDGAGIFPRRNLGTHLLRTALLVGAMTCYFFAVSRIPLALAISVFFVGPVLATILSVPILKERLTPVKLLSLALGFGGTLIMLKPGEGFEVDPGLLLALTAGICYAFYLVATRSASQNSDPVSILVFQCVVGAVLLTPQAILAWSVPSWSEVPLLLLLGAVSCFSHALSVTAFRYAEASLLTPLVYLELIGSAAIGFFVFGDVPTSRTLIGAALIVGAGLVLMRKSRSR